jgi:hypothetical protein
MKYESLPQFVFLLTNGDYKYTCKLYNTSGWICRHFFRVMCITSIARFHINMIINQHWLKDEVYGNDLSNRNFIGLIANDTVGSTIQLPVKWVSITTREVIGLSRQEQGLAQQQLKAKQRFTRVFGLAKTMINKAIELDLDEKLISILEEFQETEIKPTLYLNNTSCTQFNDNLIVLVEHNEIVANELKSNINNVSRRKILDVENLVVKCRKGRLQTARRILGSVENQQASVASKSRSITCTYCHEVGHNIRSCEERIANEK